MRALEEVALSTEEFAGVVLTGLAGAIDSVCSLKKHKKGIIMTDYFTMLYHLLLLFKPPKMITFVN
jgi:hypothetical protein